MSQKINKKNLLFLSLSILAITAGALSIFFLPERFFYDAITISKDFYNEKGWIGSYPFSMKFYHITGLNRIHFSIVALIQLPILFYILYRLGLPKRFYILTVRNILVYISFLMIAIFISMPSKEFITFIILSIIPFLFKRKKLPLWKTVALSFLILILFGIWFRAYFILLIPIAIIMHLISFIKFRNRIATVVFSGLLIAIFMSLSYGVVKGEFLSQSTREELNERRIGEDASNSIILSPIATDTFHGEAFGIVYGFFSVNVPVNGLKFILSPQILAFVIWQLFLIVCLLLNFRTTLDNRKKYRYEIWIFYFVFGYFIIQGVFEPDLGSAIRHKMGIFPLIYFALYYDYFRRQVQ